MIKKILLFTLCVMLAPLYAANNKDYFPGQNGCYILFDVKQNKLLKSNFNKRCTERFAPNSSFKVALSIMGFDSKIMTQETIFPWNGEKEFLPEWNQNQTPRTYLQYSVVWVSRQITHKLGMNTIKDYLKKFNYGNQDFSGNPGKNDGLDQAWLESSLKISPNEQLNFLTNFLTNQLPVSKEAIDNTKTNMYIETSKNGNKLFGKTGSSPKLLGKGWFIGFVEQENSPYIIIVNFIDKKPSEKNEYGGPRAKLIAKEILRDNQLL